MTALNVRERARGLASASRVDLEVMNINLFISKTSSKQHRDFALHSEGKTTD